MRYAVLVTGPAGAGKSTFCASFMTHLQTSKRSGHLVNLDPAAAPDSFEYAPSIDIKDLISVEDVMGELGYGPNGGLVYCFEYLLQNMDWLEEEVGEYEDDYLIIDCPGQIELYTHHPFLPTLVRNLQRLGMRTSAVYLLDSQFMEDKYKFFSGVLSAMSAMVNLEIPWINVMSKMDLVLPNPEDPAGGGRNGIRTRRNIARYLDPDPLLLAAPHGSGDEVNSVNPRFHALNQTLVQLIEDHPLVTFLPLDLSNPNSIENVLSHIDHAMQYGEDEEPKEVGASLVRAPFPATLPGLMEGQAWIAFDSFREMTCEADHLPFYPLLLWIHHRDPDCATYAPIAPDPPPVSTFFSLYAATPSQHPTLLGMRK